MFGQKVEPAKVWAALEKIRTGPSFSGAPKLKEFLTYIVEEALAGRGSAIKEYVIGVRVYQRPPDFDPRLDSTVRVEAVKLRKRLKSWYEGPGAADPIRISLPKGSYSPEFDERFSGRPPEAHPPVRSIVVLPFLNLGEQNDEYLADGLTEELTNALACTGLVHVISRTSAFTFKNQNQEVTKIGRQLGVDLVLEGSVRQFGTKIRISIQMISVINGYSIWAKSWEDTTHEILALQQQIAAAVAAAMRIEISEHQLLRLTRRHTDNADAFHLYMRGRHALSSFHPAALESAVQLFERALQLDAEYSLPHVGIAEACMTATLWGTAPPRGLMERSRTEALKALAVDDENAEGHAVLGAVHAKYDFDWTAAEHEYRRALELDPGSAFARRGLAMNVLCPLGRIEEAITVCEGAFIIDPLSLTTPVTIAWLVALTGDGERAIRELSSLACVNPNDFGTLFIFGDTLNRFGRYQQAMEVFATLVNASGRRPVSLSFWAYASARAGQLQAARHLLAEILEKGSFVQPISLAIPYLGLGEFELAMHYLERCVEERDSPIVYLGVDPIFEPLRINPRFEGLLKSLGLEGVARCH